jgi:four helix bundle protein
MSNIQPDGTDLFFPHERLDVYRISLSFAKMTIPWVNSWPTTVAVRDQLGRATESVIANLAKAVRLQRTDQGIYCLECSLGSVLECAACLDVAHCRHLVSEAEVCDAKRILQSVARMEVGLRNAWVPVVRETGTVYAENTGPFFAHESLAVYRRTLKLHVSLEPVLEQRDRPTRQVRRIDELSTSVTLNIAEGNGRFAKLDHGKFILIAEDSGTKLAAYLDMVEISHQCAVGAAKAYLREIMAMLSGLQGYLRK